MAGAQGMNWDVQNVSAQSMFEPPSSAGYTVAGITGESSDGVSMFTSPVHDDTEEMIVRTSWGEGEGNKEQRDVHSAMNELSSFENNPNGSHSFSRDQLSEMTGDAVKGQYAQQVINYMDKSGMSNIHFEHGKFSVDQQMVRDAGTFVNENDPKAHSALAVAKLSTVREVYTTTTKQELLSNNLLILVNRWHLFLRVSLMAETITQLNS